MDIQSIGKMLETTKLEKLENSGAAHVMRMFSNKLWTAKTSVRCWTLRTMNKKLENSVTSHMLSDKC